MQMKKIIVIGLVLAVVSPGCIKIPFMNRIPFMGDPSPPDVGQPYTPAEVADIGGADADGDTSEALRRVFLTGYDLYSRGLYLDACGLLNGYLSEVTPDDTDYEWAAFFFGISLKKAGFSHAAVDILANLVTRKPNTKIVNYSLELLEEISRDMPFDQKLLVKTALCDQSYDFVEGGIADFVNYYQGENNWEHGLFSWGDEHFRKIDPNSYYYSKYLLKNALREMYTGRTDEAISLMKQVLHTDAATKALKDDARKTLARLFYETGRFEDADLLYRRIEMNILEQSQNMLERAWVHYRMGNPERAMGLLYSFEAPSYRNSFTPEFYILKSFIYKDVCHYEKAMQVLINFKDHYGEALKQVYDRKSARDNDALLLVILHKPRVKKIWNFLSLLEREQQRCGKVKDEALSDYLTALYMLKRDEYERLFRLRVEEEYEKMANALLQFEEEAHLMEYEIGLDMYQRVSDYHYSEENGDEKKSEMTRAVYKFQGEFWNDELNNYSVTLPDKCHDAEEWDIFFK